MAGSGGPRQHDAGLGGAERRRACVRAGARVLLARRDRRGLRRGPRDRQPVAAPLGHEARREGPRRPVPKARSGAPPHLVAAVGTPAHPDGGRHRGLRCRRNDVRVRDVHPGPATDRSGADVRDRRGDDPHGPGGSHRDCDSVSRRASQRLEGGWGTGAPQRCPVLARLRPGGGARGRGQPAPTRTHVQWTTRPRCRATSREGGDSRRPSSCHPNSGPCGRTSPTTPA